MDISNTLHPVDWFNLNRSSLKPIQDYQWIFPYPPKQYEGFSHETLALPRSGKITDYVCSLPGDGRLHAQFFNGLGWIFHWDKYDPAQGEIVEHLWHEVKPTKPILTAGLLLLSFLALSKDN